MLSIPTPSKKSLKVQAAATDKHEYEEHGYSLGCDILCYNCERYMVLFTSKPVSFFSNASNVFSSTFILKDTVNFYLTLHIRSYYSFGREYWKYFKHQR